MASELEKAITDALKSRNLTALRGFLQNNTNEALKCSAQFLKKLDDLITWSLDEKNFNAACVAFAVLHNCGRNLKFPTGSQGISGIIDQGLIQKMFQWLNKCKQLWIQHGPQWDKSLCILSEDFFDAVTMIHKASNEAMVGIQSFMYSVGQLVNDARVCIIVRKEAIYALNIILKKITVSPEKETILTSQEASDLMMNLAGQIMQCGDYDLQVALIEVLFRMTTPDQRKKLAAHWFSTAQVACAFDQIHPSEFEADCRTFLTVVNGSQGDSRRVKSYPCLEVYLDNFKLLKPADDKLDQFWIDFNLDSQSISFYFSFADEKSSAGLWDSISVPENEIHSYTVTAKGKKQILQLQLCELVIASSVKGSRITITFCSTLDILQTVCCIYGQKKNKSAVGKASSVFKKLKILIEENKSKESFVPESQVSLGDCDENTASCLGTAQQTSLQIPASGMHSGLTAFSDSSSKGGKHRSNSPAETKGKPSLEMCRASDRNKSAYLAERKTADETFKCLRTMQNIPLIREPERRRAGQGTDQSQEGSVVPDTQPLTERNTGQRNKLSLSKILKRQPPKKNPLANSDQCSNVAKKQEHPLSAQMATGSSKGKQIHSKSARHLQQSLKEKNPGGSRDLELRIPKELQPQGKRHDETKSRGRQSLVAASTEASTSRQERNSNNKGAKEAIDNMVKLISSHYSKTNQCNEKVGSIHQRWIQPNISSVSLLSAGKKDAQAKEVTKSHSKITSNCPNKRNDVFEFGIDESFTIREVQNTFLGKCATSSKDIHGSSVHLTASSRKQQATKEKRTGRKHLVSGTDDTNSPDVSWLRESSEKAKLKLTYARNQPIMSKTFQPHNSKKFPVVPQSTPKPGKSNARLNKKVMELSKNDIPETGGEPFSVSKRPRRSTALAKSYKEPDTDDSLSESEKPQATKAREIPQPNKSSVTKGHAQQQTPKCPRLNHKTPAFSTEKMRFSDMSAQTPELAFSPLVNLPLSSSSKGKSMNQLSSSPLSVSPVLTPAKRSPISASSHSQLSGATMNPDLNYSLSQESAVSQVSLSLSLTIGVQQRTLASQAVCQKTEKTPQSNQDSPDTLVSGPSRKRHISLCSNSEEKERQKRKRLPSMKPRVLFNSCAEENIEGEMTTSFSVMTNHLDTDRGNGEMDLEDLELPDVRLNLSNLSPQLASKLKTKFQIQNRFKLMDSYSKENMKTVQQHISSLSMRLRKHRTQKFEDVKNVFLQEIRNLEQGKAMLNSMEKNLNRCLERQHTFFQSYHEQETKSIEVLRRTLNDMRSSPEYEEPLFMSQMAHLKKDMKSIQERLLRTMHEEALEGLRRGLRAWVLVD
ncbi:synaptonemal complex protein 2 isoform X2 [Hippocampus comes]|uniref:synaptonemal complex protein 2 isoform X2 n=1 Tax=Hippocampus comes TaxID=109280 RepID=UPI00094E3DAF|nr:PREDICTED: synaptonemal complex protein 2-like isoform X2 [Hippocampus comes]